MTLQVMKRTEAPSFAKHSSSFKNDERCVEVDFVIGDDYTEVVKATQKLWLDNEFIDYDINWSIEGEKWVGVTCEDI